MDTSPPTGKLQSAPGRCDVFTKVNFRCDRNLSFLARAKCRRAFTNVNEKAPQSARGVNTLKRKSFAQERLNEFRTTKSARQQGRFSDEHLPDDD